MPTDLSDPQLEALLVYLRDHRGVDFTGYKRPSLTRLIDRRMRAAGVESYAEYVDLLQVQSTELAALLDALLINVTAVLRDPAAWAALRDTHLPAVLAELGPDEPVRVWSAACASGEEAYTLAVLLHELLGDAEYKRRVKIYATDIDDDALATARAGRYPARALEPLSDEQRETCFEPDGDGYRFRADLRPSVIFGRHDLLTDAPISRVALLSCRNVLMYFTPETQTRVLERFAFALHPKGLLLLGKAEMLLTQSQLFTPVDLGQRVFRARARTHGSRLAALAVGGSSSDGTRHRVTEAAFSATPAAQVVLDRHGVVTLVNERAQSDLGLSPDDVGRVFHELELSYRPVELRSSVAAAQSSRRAVELPDVEWAGEQASTWWDVCVSPLQDGADVIGIHLVFRDVTERHELRSQLDQANRQLSTAYEELQSSSEELETTNEELQSAVEELETTNEELQSTNEELETMNEELQSTNEELQTLNDELRERTIEIDEVNGFLRSILQGLEQAVVVVDVDLRVQLWNPGAERLTGLRDFEAEGLRLPELDVGLPLQEVLDVLRTVVQRGEDRAVVEAGLTDRFGRRQHRRLLVRRLRGEDGRSRGAVVTLHDEPDAAAPAPEATDDGQPAGPS